MAATYICVHLALAVSGTLDSFNNSRMDEAADAIDDSEDEVDYTKMDQGNKKGPIGRWDFDTQEEYSDYMANKEALPKYVHKKLFSFSKVSILLPIRLRKCMSGLAGFHILSFIKFSYYHSIQSI